MTAKQTENLDGPLGLGSKTALTNGLTVSYERRSIATGATIIQYLHQ